RGASSRSGTPVLMRAPPALRLPRPSLNPAAPASAPRGCCFLGALHARGLGRVDDALLEPGVAAREDVAGERVGGGVCVPADRGEEPRDPVPRLLAEHVCEPGRGGVGGAPPHVV